MPRALTPAARARYWREWQAERSTLYRAVAKHRDYNFNYRAVKRHRLGVDRLTAFDNGPTLR